MADSAEQIRLLTCLVDVPESLPAEAQPQSACCSSLVRCVPCCCRACAPTAAARLRGKARRSAAAWLICPLQLCRKDALGPSSAGCCCLACCQLAEPPPLAIHNCSLSGSSRCAPVGRRLACSACSARAQEQAAGSARATLEGAMQAPVLQAQEPATVVALARRPGRNARGGSARAEGKQELQAACTRLQRATAARPSLLRTPGEGWWEPGQLRVRR